MSAFDTFLTALSKTTNHQGILGEYHIEFPPNEHVDYWATPQNAVVFGWMGVDGVHYALLKIDNRICDESPVIQIGPMDFDEPYALLGPTFTDFLAIGCGSNRQVIEELLTVEDSGRPCLLDFLRSHFDDSRFLLDDPACDIAPWMTMIISKPEVDQ